MFAFVYKTWRFPQIVCSASRDWKFLLIGATVAFLLHVAAHWTSRLPVWQRLIRRFVWWKDGLPPEQAPVGEILNPHPIPLFPSPDQNKAFWQTSAYSSAANTFNEAALARAVMLPGAVSL